MENRNKFRGISKDKGKWVYGSLITRNCDGYDRCYIYDNDVDETEFEEMIKEDLYTMIDPKTVGQCLGFRDCKRNFIYFGDIIEFENGDKVEVCCGEYFEPYCEEIGESECEDQWRDFYRIMNGKIIGNIYQEDKDEA